MVVERKVVVDNDGVGDAKRVELHRVNTDIVELGVQEDSLNSAWVLSKSRGCREEPTVAECTLVDILDSDALVAKQSVRAKEV